MRIYIIGNSCSGKTTLAHKLGKEFGLPVYSTDDIYWVHKFDTPRTKMEMIAMLGPIARSPDWVIEGGSTSWTISAIRRADIIIELKVHRVICVRRAFGRFAKRLFAKDGSRETILNVIRLCRYIWTNDHPRKRHMRQYNRLMTHAKGHRVQVKTPEDLRLAKTSIHLIHSSKASRTPHRPSSRTA